MNRFPGMRPTYPQGGSQLQGVRGYQGMGQLPDPTACAVTTEDALMDAVCAREARVNFLLEHGEPFWLPTSLGLGTTPAAGTQFQSTTTSVDFDLLVIGAESTLYKSTIDIRDSARQRILTNAPTPIGAIADFQINTGAANAPASQMQFRNFWYKPYLLPARSQFAYTVAADGTESNGVFTLYCLQPPTYTS
jgi:hypothetical protein